MPSTLVDWLIYLKNLTIFNVIKQYQRHEYTYGEKNIMTNVKMRNTNSIFSY